jgi:cytoskeletal protein CcmA (bactofilin family)
VGILNITGDLNINTNKFNITASSGNVSTAGTLNVTGTSLLTGNTRTAGNMDISGNTMITGNMDLNGSLIVRGIVSDATPSNIIYYNTTSKALTYGTAPSGGWW